MSHPSHTQMVIPSSCSLPQRQKPLSWQQMVTTPATALTLHSTRRLPLIPSSRPAEGATLHPPPRGCWAGRASGLSVSLLWNVKAQAFLCTCKGARFYFSFAFFFFLVQKTTRSLFHTLSHVHVCPTHSPTHSPTQSCVSLDIDHVHIDTFILNAYVGLNKSCPLCTWTSIYTI